MEAESQNNLPQSEPQKIEEMPHPPKKSTLPLLFLILLLLLVVSFGMYFLGRNSVKPISSPLPIVSQSTPEASTAWKTYTNSLSGYSFQYPPNYYAKLANHNILTFRSNERLEGDEPDYTFDSNIKIVENKDKLPLKEFVEKEHGVVNGKITDYAEYFGDPVIRDVLTFEEKTVDGKNAYLFRADPCAICRFETYNTYIVLSPDEVLEWSISIDEPKLYDQILSTFKISETGGGLFKACPQYWVEVEKPNREDAYRREGFRVDFDNDGEVEEHFPKTFDLDWIRENCEIKEPEVIEF